MKYCTFSAHLVAFTNGNEDVPYHFVLHIDLLEFGMTAMFR